MMVALKAKKMKDKKAAVKALNAKKKKDKKAEVFSELIGQLVLADMPW